MLHVQNLVLRRSKEESGKDLETPKVPTYDRLGKGKGCRTR